MIVACSITPRLIAFTTLSLCLVAGGTAATAGSIRYELPTLLGEHRYDGTGSPISGRFAFVDTSFHFYDIAQARLVVEGRVTAGKARGDGVLRKDLEFDLLPSVAVEPSFSTTLAIPRAPTPESFLIEKLYPHPFVPETTPLPNPDGYPPVSFFVHVSVGPSLATSFPPLITPPAPGELVYATDGMIVLEPIIADITSAYVVLSGPGVVPAPSGLAVVVIACAGLLMTRRRFPSRPGGSLGLRICATSRRHPHGPADPVDRDRDRRRLPLRRLRSWDRFLKH